MKDAFDDSGFAEMLHSHLCVSMFYHAGPFRVQPLNQI